MKEHEPIRFAITGTDGAGKETDSNEFVRKLAELDYQVILKLNRPNYRVKQGKLYPEFPKTIAGVDILHSAADKTRNRGLIASVNAINVVLQTRLIEPHLTRVHDPNVIVTSRDFLIDPSVYTVFYAPRSLGAMRPESRLRFFKRLTHMAFNDAIVLLTVNPDIADKRIEERIQKEHRTSNEMRNKWRHLHENPLALARLAEEYYPVIDAMRIMRQTPVLEINTDQKTPSEIAGEIVVFLEAFKSGEINPSDWIRV